MFDFLGDQITLKNRRKEHNNDNSRISSHVGILLSIGPAFAQIEQITKGLELGKRSELSDSRFARLDQDDLGVALEPSDSIA